MGVFIFVISMLCLAGCASTRTINKFGAGLPPEKVVHLQINHLCVVSIDGESVNDEKCDVSGINLEPGKHQVVLFRIDTHDASAEDSRTVNHTTYKVKSTTTYTSHYSEEQNTKILEFDGVAGKKYKVEAHLYLTYWDGKIVEANHD